ncbi:collagenase [Paraglaciecola arctica]|uniref:microbial collagenase n=1 Tax=Paraglaciecola arctica BSs20135 TaxID=493475 RepID=K6YPT1_9ALTE|nr:collagenase [Paraglaciecola arctica]GAC20182.1 collagenase family protein [Paraglaciecola arctica BSs20135]
MNIRKSKGAFLLLMGMASSIAIASSQLDNNFANILLDTSISAPAIGSTETELASRTQVEHSRNVIQLLPEPAFSDNDTKDSDASPTISSKKLNIAAKASAMACNDNAFVTSGTNLLNVIKNQGSDCVDRLFTLASTSVRLGSFTDANIITVANETKSRSQTYNGTDPDGYLYALYYWLRAAYFYGNRELLTPANQAATKAALQALVANSHFFDKTVENAILIDIAMPVMGSASVAHEFVGTVRALLARYDQSYEAIGKWGNAAATIIWNILNDCAREQSCRAQQHDLALVTSLSDFIHNNIAWLDMPENDYHLHNLGAQLGNLYSGASQPHFAAIETELQTRLTRLFNDFGPLETDIARRAYLQAMTSVIRYQKCQTYGLCSKKDEVIAAVLDDRINCPSGTLFMWAQDLNQAQLQWACSSLGTHEDYFHATLQTGNTPVVPDDNDKLRMIVFNNSREWKIYGYALFFASTDNGGLYLEGDPSTSGDQATFFAYEDVSARPVFDIWNLRHEYVHYLDGRFNTQGDFGDINGAGRTVWYGEGLAEFISRRNCNDEAASQAALGTYALSTIFENEYGVGQTRIYPWGHLAVRFMFENHNNEFFAMLNEFRQGNYSNYRTNMVDSWVSNQTFDSEFSSWLPTVQSTGCTVDNTRPPSPVEPIDVDDVQGNDQFGINACALGRPPEDRTIKAGQAICLKNTANSNQLQMGLNVPTGLVNVSLKITLQYGTGNANLLHRFDVRPNSTTYDHISQGAGNNETIVVDSVSSGWNYIHVRADSSFSDVTLLARYIQNDDTNPPDDSVLSNNVAKNVTAGQGEEKHFSMQVPANTSSLKFTTSGGTGDADLYVKFGSAPTSATYDCRPWKGGNNEQCVISNVQQGTYYVMLRGYNNFTNVSLVGSYTSGGPTNNTPTAQANGPYAAVVGGAVSFSSNGSTDSDGSISSYQWNFGDGNSSASPNPSHSYTAAGIYTATLTVTDNQGATGVDTASITVGAASGLENACLTEGQVNNVPLSSGDAVCVQSNNVANGRKDFYFWVPSGNSQVKIESGHGSGDASLYYKQGAWPTNTNFHQSSTNSGNNEQIIANNPAGNWHYVIIHGVHQGMTLKLTIE